MNDKTIFRVASKYENFDLLVYPIRKVSESRFYCGVLSAGHCTVNRTGDNVLRDENEMTLATLQDFKEFRICPDGYDNF